MYNNPITKSIIPPIIVDIFPYFLFKIFPRFSPRKVNNKLVTENTLADNITPDLERQLDNRKNAINASTVDEEKLKDKLKDLPKIDIPVEFAGIKELERRLSIIRGLIKGINNTTVNVKTEGAVPKRSGDRKSDV